MVNNITILNIHSYKKLKEKKVVNQTLMELAEAFEVYEKPITTKLQYIEEGIMGPNKTPGSVIFIESDQKVIFRDESAEIRSGVILSGDEERGQWSKFLESGRETGVYVLFPGNTL